jgi:ABC-2 type transport system permease protein
MTQWLSNVFRLGLKELASVWRDRGMMVFMVWAFTGAIYLVSSSAGTEMRNASVGFVDGDQSRLSYRIRDALQAPLFKRPETLDRAAINQALDGARHMFVIDVPPHFERDVLAGRRTALQVNVDATAMAQAGAGAGYIQAIVHRELAVYLGAQNKAEAKFINSTVRSFFNPNLDDFRHLTIMEIVNNVCLLSIMLVGAAVVREREHGTIEHLLVMPVTPTEIVAAKLWANGLVVLIAVMLSLNLIARFAMGVPVNGSIALYLAGAAVFLFAVMALGVMLATLSNSMPQFALIAFPAVVVMEVLSGGMTPIESMPGYLQLLMSAVPSTHYVAFSQAVLFRGAGLDIVWPKLAWMAGLGALYVAIALGRFRRMLAADNR